MPGFSTAMSNEIKRVARKELKPDMDSVKSSASTHRHEIAALKRRVKDLETLVMKLTKVQLKTAPEAASKVITAKQTRWSASGFARLRAKLGLSAKEMGLLLDVSAATIHLWEDENSNTRPRPKSMPRILAARKLTATKARTIIERLS